MFTKSGTEKQLNLFSSSGELEEYCKLLPGRQKMANIVTFLLRQKLQDISQEELYSQEINVETAIFQLGYHYPTIRYVIADLLNTLVNLLSFIVDKLRSNTKIYHSCK